jgi:glycosyltransferase involved in cell wall biosynthesis
MEQDTGVKTVSFMAADKWGCGYYRMFLPSIALCRQGIPAHLITTDRIHLYNLANTLVIQRPADPSIEGIVDEAKDRGIKVVFELDDDIWNLPDWNHAYPFWTTMRTGITTNILKKCNRAVTTTEPLANVLRKYNDDVIVVPNCVFDHKYIDLPKKLKYDSDIIIAWIGSSFHQKDTEVFGSLIPTVFEKYSNIGMLFMGEPPPKELSPYFNRIISLPFVEPIYYHQILGSFQMHIGLAPLVECDFNRAKSAIKLLEYLYTTAFPICSDIDPYSNIKKEMENSCMLVPTQQERAGNLDDWMDAIDFCVKNIDKVMEYAEEGKKFVLDRYNIETDAMTELYKKAYFVD